MNNYQHQRDFSHTLVDFYASSEYPGDSRQWAGLDEQASTDRADTDDEVRQDDEFSPDEWDKQWDEEYEAHTSEDHDSNITVLVSSFFKRNCYITIFTV